MSKQRFTRREFLRLGAMTGAGMALAACAPPVAPPAAAPAATAVPEVKPTEAPAAAPAGYQGKFVVLSAGNADQNAPLIAAIEEANPGVKVEWRGLTSERYTELFAAAEVAGDQIDLMDLNGQDLRRYAVGGKLKDLSDLTYKDRFRDVGIRTYTIGGKLWALPRGGISGFAYLYNKKSLEKVGVTTELVTYDDLMQIAPELKKAGIAPFVHPGKNIYLWPIWQFWAYAQTSGNKSVENTWKTLAGDMKFTDPEHVAALEILDKYARDGMFIESVNSMDRDAVWINFSQGKGAFYYEHTYLIGTYREGDYPDLDMSLELPLSSVKDTQRQLPGGTGSADGIYAKIAPERLDVAFSILDLITTDKWVKWANDLNKDPVSCNVNVQASDDPLSLKYANECADQQTTYLDWYWPPEITRAFQENQQAIVAGTKKPDEAAQAIQKVLDGLYTDGYKFEM
jgi:raffinose/stachyose/melibiose transport system substrate-binding protein